MTTLHQLRHASKLKGEAYTLLDRLDTLETIPGATLQRAFDRVRRRRKLWERAADAHWGPLEPEANNVQRVAA